MNKIYFGLEDAKKVYEVLMGANVKKVYLRGIEVYSWSDNIAFFCKEAILCEDISYEDEKVNIDHLKYLNYFHLIEGRRKYDYYICYFEENIKLNLDLKEYIRAVRADEGVTLISKILNLSINQIEYLKFDSFSLENKKKIVESILKYDLKISLTNNPMLDEIILGDRIEKFEERKEKLSKIKNEFFNYIDGKSEIELTKKVEPSIAKFLFYKSIIIAEKKENLNDEDFLEVIKGYFRIDKDIQKDTKDNIDNFFYASHFRRMIYYYINILLLLKKMKKESDVVFDKSSNESSYLRGFKKISYNKIKEFLNGDKVKKMNIEDIKLVRKLYENYLKEEILIKNPKLTEKIKLEYEVEVGNICSFSDKFVEKVIFVITEKLENGELYIIMNKNGNNYVGKYNEYLSNNKFSYFENENSSPKFEGILHEDILFKGIVKKIILKERHKNIEMNKEPSLFDI